MIINKYFSCHYVEILKANLLFKLELKVFKPLLYYTGEFDVLRMLISAYQRLGLASKSVRLVSA